MLGPAQSHLPKLLVLYTTGAAAPTDIVTAAAELADVTFAGRTSDASVRTLGRLLSTIGACVWYENTRDLTELASRFDAVVTFAESRLSDLAVVVEAARRPGPNREVVRRLTHKPTQRSALAAAGLPVPRWRTAATLAEVIGAWASLDNVPCVVKPVVGMGSVNTIAVDHEADLAALPSGALEYIVEERLIGRAMPHPRAADYCSVEIASSGGVHTVLAVSGRLPLVAPFRESGAFLPALLTARERDEVVAMAQRALDACGLRDGLSHVEMKLTLAGPRVIEVNGRLGGNIAHLVGESSGRDLVRDAILCALGRAPEGATDAGSPDDARPVGRNATVFRWFVYAPEIDGNLTSLRGLDRVRALPTVTRVKRLLRDGDSVSWTRGTASAVVQVDGWGEDLDAVDRVLDVVAESLDIRVSVAS